MARRKGWLDRMLRRAMDAENPEDLEKIKEEYKDQMPAEMHEGPDGDEEHQHIHVHLPGAGGGESGGEGGGEDRRTHDDPNEERLAALEALCEHLKATVEELGQKISGGEEDEGEPVEMENEETGDKARYIMRRHRGDRKARDEELPLPDKTPEMMGETDLPGTSAGDRKRVKDSVYLEPTWQDVVAAAEILSPGIRVPTFDAAQHWSTSAKRLCALRRRALDGACAASEDGRKIVDGVVGGEWKVLGPRLMCDSVTVAFNAATTQMRQRNNDRASGNGRMGAADDGWNIKAGPASLAELNKINRDAYPGGHRAR
jgi:hypothetical protein